MQSNKSKKSTTVVNRRRKGKPSKPRPNGRVQAGLRRPALSVWGHSVGVINMSTATTLTQYNILPTLSQYPTLV